MGRGTRLAGDSGVLPVTWSKGSDGVLLVRPLQSLAPDLEVEEPNSELGQDETIAQPRGIGKGSCGGGSQVCYVASTSQRVAWLRSLGLPGASRSLLDRERNAWLNP